MIGGIGKQPVAVRLLLQLLEYGLNHLVGFVDGVVVLIRNIGFAEYFILRLQQCAVWGVRTALVQHDKMPALLQIDFVEQRQQLLIGHIVAVAVAKLRRLNQMVYPFLTD